MTARRVAITLSILAVIHNALRFAATSSGASSGFFNYLHPWHLHWRENTAVPLCGSLIVVGLALAVAYKLWREPSTPSSPLFSSVFWSMITGALASLFAVMVAASADRSYGWVMFVLVPFVTGLHATFALSRRKRITLKDALAASVLSALLLGALLLATAVEGVICLVMASPLAVVLAMLGGFVGWLIADMNQARHPLTFLMIVGLTPFSATLERAVEPEASLFQVTTSIDLAASPERVWHAVLQPAVLAPPTEPLLRAGVGYPEKSHIEGTGITATRYCDFSTGKLVEPVLIWNEPKQLRFTVTQSPIPMQEWTPYAHLHPPHLDGFLITRQGQFRLIPLPGGHTRLEATTWYQHHLWPEQYWRWWSDDIIHSIHKMVLTDIRDRALLPE